MSERTYAHGTGIPLSAKFAKRLILVIIFLIRIFLDCVVRGNYKFYLTDVMKPIFGNYLMLESIALESGAQREIHFLQADGAQKSFIVGRSVDCDVLLNEPSCSRVHALIKFRNDGFFIKDCQSKFGTLILLRDELEISMDIPSILIQVGNSLIKIKPRRAKR